MNKYIIFGLLLFVTAYPAFAGKFTVKGVVYRLENYSPAVGSRAYSAEDSIYEKETNVLDSAEIKIFYGSDFSLTDESVPKELGQPAISGKDGKFVFTGSLDSSQTKKILVSITRPGYAGTHKTLLFDPKKKEYTLVVFLVKSFVFKRH